MNKYIALFSLLVVSSLAFANAEEHASNEIPKVVFWQAVNLIILFVGLFYATKGHIVNLFKTRRETFLNAAEKSQKVKQEAEKTYLEIKNKLDTLKINETESIQRAKADALVLKEKMLHEAKEISDKAIVDAQSTIKMELNKAKNKLRDELISESFSIAKNNLTKDISITDHARLQGEMVNKIEVVR